MGREYIPLSDGNIEVELGFDGIYDDQLVFDLVVINHGSEPLTIQPGDFYYVLLDSATADSSMLPPRMALKPEKVLIQYDEYIEDKQEQKTANTFMGILEAGAGLLATTAAVITTENPAYIFDGIGGLFGTAGHYIEQDKQIEADMEMIHEEKEVVDEELFRSCQVLPGKGASGYVYFPKHSDTEYYMFCFPLEEQLFQFVYRQEKVVEYH